MKKNISFYLFSILISLNLLSCSQEEFQDINPLQSSVNEFSGFASDSIYVINNCEDLFYMFDIELEFQNENEEFTTRSSMLSMPVNKQIKGYTSITNSSKYRTTFGAEMAKQLGLRANTIYHVYMKYVKIEIPLPSGGIAFESTSPGCGYKPIYSPSHQEVTDFSDRGYKVISSQAPKAVFDTNILFVENEEWGANIKKDFPCKPADIIWNYTLWAN